MILKQIFHGQETSANFHVLTSYILAQVYCPRDTSFKLFICTPVTRTIYANSKDYCFTIFLAQYILLVEPYTVTLNCIKKNTTFFKLCFELSFVNSSVYATK